MKEKTVQLFEAENREAWEKIGKKNNMVPEYYEEARNLIKKTADSKIEIVDYIAPGGTRRFCISAWFDTPEKMAVADRNLAAELLIDMQAAFMAATKNFLEQKKLPE